MQFENNESQKGIMGAVVFTKTTNKNPPDLKQSH